MNQNRLARKVNKEILKWAQQTTKLVVAIDGYTGAGKTTLLNNLLRLNSQILPVSRDDFQIPSAKFRRLYRNKTGAERSKLFELEMNDTKKLEKVVTAFRKSDKPYRMRAYDGISGKLNIPKVYDFSKRVMVVEGIFMLHPKLLSHLWDKSIYLAGDVNKIDKRRVRREKKRWGKNYFPETHPDSYFRQVIIALKRYQRVYKPEKTADLTLFVG